MTIKCLKENVYEARLTEQELEQLKQELIDERDVKYSEYTNISIVERKNKAVAVKMVVEG